MTAINKKIQRRKPESGVEIKGLPNYRIYYDQGDIKIWSKRNRKWIKKSEGSSLSFSLRCENKTKHFSPGFLRFLMLHPELDARTIHPAEQRIKFAPDGTVKDLYEPGEKRAVKSSRFVDIDDALATVLVMKAVSGGDLKFVHTFITHNRQRAVWAVARILKASPNKVRESLDEGEELFITQLSNAHCEKIVPLFSWLCRSIKSVMLGKRNLISIERTGLAATRAISTDAI